MKNVGMIIGAVCFLLGIVAFSAWDKMNYVSIPKPKQNAPRSIASEATGQQLIVDNFNEAISSIKNKSDVDAVLAGYQTKSE